MKRFLSLVIMMGSMVMASAQMNVWKGSSLTQYQLNDIDSITFGIPAIKSMSIEPNTMLFTDLGDTDTLKVTIIPALDYVLSWKSSKPSVAVVNKDGVVTPLSNGTTFITAQYGSIQATSSVKVELTELTLSETSVEISEGAKKQITTAIKHVTWKSKDDTIASVDAEGVITAHKVGSTVITAMGNGQSKQVQVVVTNKVKGSQIWPIVLDETTASQVSSKIVADFRSDNINKFFYIWASGETYREYYGTGINFYGNTENYPLLVVVAPNGWSGAGWCVGANVAPEAEKLRAAIVASPDDYYLHMALKSTTTGNHQFYTFDNETTSFAIGTSTIEEGAVVGDFIRDGSWYEFDIPMSQFATALADKTFNTGGDNIFCILSGGQVGARISLDAVYFYKK